MKKLPFLKPRELGPLEWIVLVVIMTGIYIGQHGIPR
jgi:hypothetical protein